MSNTVLPQYWTEEEQRMLEDVTEFRHMTPIAFRVLERMPGRIHEVCGPISTGGWGCPRRNLAFYGFAIEELVRHGLAVFDNRPFQDVMERIINTHQIKGYAMGIFHDFYYPIFESGRIVTAWHLPDWQSSTGTKLEYKKFMELNIPWVPFPTEWLTGFEMPAELAA
jgi:hypothetical protein